MMRCSIDVAEMFYRIQRARRREARAAVNFAPPVLGRLNEKYNRPRRRYFASGFEPGSDELCGTCAALDLVALFRDGIECEMGDGIRVRKGIPMGWSDVIYRREKCPLCRLLVEMGDTNMSGDRREVEFWSIITLKAHEVVSNVADPLYEVVDKNETGVDRLPPGAIYLALVRTVKPPPRYGFEYRTIFKDLSFIGMLGAEKLNPPRSFTLREMSDAAEIVQRLRVWFQECSRHGTCPARQASAWSHPDGFRLFDTSSLRVVDSNGKEPYIALSYTWAQVDQVQVIEQGKPYALETLPNVLQDVIRVVRGLDLGINHIWMDQLCVDQADMDQRKKSIRAMGAIYGAAFATIIFAVPSRGGPEEGLPGFSAQRYPGQHVETIGNVKLATTLPSLEMAISTSQWNTRGWTLEEGILSSRCILFGPEQVYFECAEMACCESMEDPSVAMSEQRHLMPYKSRLQNPFLRTYNFDALFWRLIRDYTGRDMTHAKDALNAFSAFAVEFERDGHRLLWGLPETNIVHNLMWERDYGDFRQIQRRDGFPSWSWAGWTGTAAMNFSLEPSSTAQYTCTVTVEPPDGLVLACNARTAYVGVSGLAGIWSIVGASNSSIMMDCGVYAGADLPSQAFIMMEVFRMEGNIHGLLLEQKGYMYERVGSGYVSCSDLEDAGLEWQKLRLR